MRTEKEKIIKELRKQFKEQIEYIETFQYLNQFTVSELKVIEFYLKEGNYWGEEFLIFHFIDYYKDIFE